MHLTYWKGWGVKPEIWDRMCLLFWDLNCSDCNVDIMACWWRHVEILCFKSSCRTVIWGILSYGHGRIVFSQVSVIQFTRRAALVPTSQTGGTCMECVCGATCSHSVSNKQYSVWSCFSLSHARSLFWINKYHVHFGTIYSVLPALMWSFFMPWYLLHITA